MKTTLVTVVTGETYVEFAREMFASAEEFFHPTDQVEFLALEGTPGWPEATMMRWHHLHENMPLEGNVFLCDADMIFENHVGPEILGDGLTVVQHPGYVDMPEIMLPYERRKESACGVAYGQGREYYAGGFVGGPRAYMLAACIFLMEDIDCDQQAGITPVWHDESALNKFALYWPPEVVLNPGYCYPDNDSWYKTIWKQEYERKLVALDKTVEQRVGR